MKTDNALRYLWDSLDEVSELEGGGYIAFKSSNGTMQGNEGSGNDAIYSANLTYKNAFSRSSNFNPSILKT